MIEINKKNYFDELQVVTVRELCGLTCSDVLVRDTLRIGLMSGTEVLRDFGKKKITVRCPFIFFSFPGSSYSWQTSAGVSRDSFFFDICGARADSIGFMLQHDFPEGVLEVRNGSAFKRQLELISETFFSCPERFSFRLPLLIEEFLAMIYRELDSGMRSGKYEQQIMKDAELVKSAPGECHDFSLRAAALGITSIHYRRIFKSITGVPPYEYLQKCRLLLALKLLKSEPPLKIKEIALLCGFMDPTEFSRFFRKQTGFAPSEYFRNFSE